MTNKRRLVSVLCWVLLLPGAFALVASRVSAQETGQPEVGPGTQFETLFAGVLNYTVMKTENVGMNLVPALANAFEPIVLPCPATAGAAGCTYRVTVTSQFHAISSFNTGQVNLTITGPGALGPNELINVVSDTSLGLAETHSAQWVKKNIPAGSSPTITVQFRVLTGTGLAGFRTLSIEVYKGLL